jgi:hypothetical protein
MLGGTKAEAKACEVFRMCNPNPTEQDVTSGSTVTASMSVTASWLLLFGQLGQLMINS